MTAASHDKPTPEHRVIIRPADPAELPVVGDLRVTAYRADDFLPETSSYLETLRHLGADGTGDVLVAVDGGAIVGTVMLTIGTGHGQLAQTAEEAEIRALAVAPQARGRGIGRALVAAVTEQAIRRGIRHLLLLTQPEMRAAQHLYAQAGFQRLPGLDWSPMPGVNLLAYGRVLRRGT